MKRIIIIGASSGIGRELAKHFLKEDYIIGIAARRENLLNEIKDIDSSRVFVKDIDVSKPQAKERLEALIEEMGGMDRFVYCSGTGYVNMELDFDKEMQTIEVNTYGFTQLMNVAYHYFSKKGQGHIIGIASVAGVRTIYNCPAYSSTKGFNIMYLKAIRDLAKKQKYNIKVTTILPGFIATDLLKSRNYPLTTSVEKGGRMIFKAIIKERKFVFTPSYWGFISFFMRLIPPFIWKKII